MTREGKIGSNQSPWISIVPFYLLIFNLIFNLRLITVFVMRGNLTDKAVVAKKRTVCSIQSSDGHQPAGYI